MAFVLLGPAIVLAVEFALMCGVNRRSTTLTPTLRQVIRAWICESLLFLKVFAWRQPFRSTAVPDAPSGRRWSSRGVILVHGYGCNRAIWNDWLLRLQRLKVAATALNLEPPWSTIESYTSGIECAVQRMEAQTGAPPVVVAHSMGGLAVRMWLSTAGNLARVHHVITLGTPHRGTWLARFGLGLNVRQMRPASPWLLALAAREGDLNYRHMTCFYSHCDNVVFPATNATLPGADNRHVAGCAHLQLIDHPDCWGALQATLVSDCPRATT